MDGWMDGWSGPKYSLHLDAQPLRANTCKNSFCKNAIYGTLQNSVCRHNWETCRQVACGWGLLTVGLWPVAARLLRSWVRILPGAWIFVCCECRVLSGKGLCDELITRPEDSYLLCCVVVCDLETSRMGAPYIYDISRLRVKLKTKIQYSISKITYFHYSPLFLLPAYSAKELPSMTSLLLPLSSLPWKGPQNLSTNLIFSPNHVG